MDNSVEKHSYGIPTTVKLDDQVIDQLDGLAQIDQIRRAAEIRSAVAWYLQQRLSDPNLGANIEAAKQRTDRILDSLA